MQSINKTISFLNFIFFISWISGLNSTALAASQTISDLEQSLIQQIGQAETDMKAASPKERIQVLDQLKESLEQRESHLENLNPDESRPYRFSLNGYSIYIGMIPSHLLKSAECDQVSARIQYDARPLDDNLDNLQEEAKAALRLLKYLCAAKS